MMRRLLLPLLMLPAIAATGPQSELDELLRGKVAGADRRCIMPDGSAPPRVINGTAIVYWRSPETYVAHFQGGCPQLRDDRVMVTTHDNGSLCANDPVRVLEAGGGGAHGFCTFSGFTPYKKAK